MTSKDFCESTEVTTGDGETTVIDGGGALKAVIVDTDGTNDVTVECYDGTVASGAKIFSANVQGSGRSKEFMIPGRGRKVTNKLNVQVTGTGGSAFIYHGN